MAKLVNTVSSAQSVIPAWYTNAGMDLLASQQAVMDRDYNAYGGERIAGLTGDTMAGLEQARKAAADYQAQLNAASASVGKAVGSGSLAAAKPWYEKAGALNGLTAADPYLQNAAGMSAMGSASPALQQSLGYTQQSVGPLGLSMAQPWLDKSASDATDVSAYLNPYDDAVVKQIGEIGARTLREQLAPAIRDKFVASGQSGGPGLLTASGQSVDEARALRDVYADTLAKQSELLQQGYTQAQATKQSDLARYAGLAGTAGNLGFQQQGALSNAAGQYSDVGKALGSLTSADQAAQAGIGAQYGALTQAQQQALIGIGSGTASASQADTQARLQAAQQQAALAQQQQAQQLAAANALQQAGALQQTQNQKSLDQQYQDFLAQQNYPQTQIDNALKTYQGVASGVPQGTVGYEQQVKGGSGASVASQALGALSAAKGLGVI